MGFLERITEGVRPRPQRTLLYGTAGIGKTTFAADAERPIFLPTEDGLGQIDAASFPLAESFDDVMSMIGELYTANHDYRTVVLDSLDWLERLIHAHRCAKDGKRGIEDYGYGKGYIIVLGEWRELLAGLDAIRRDRGMQVILIAHAQVERFNNPETEPYDRYSPRLHKAASAMVQEWCDNVLFASYVVRTKTTEDGFKKTRTRAIDANERVIRTTERATHIAKNRLAMPDELPLAYSQYAAFLPKTT